MRGCRRVTGTGFIYIKGIHSLNINHCDQITEASLAHIEGILHLYAYDCKQLTDTSFTHLKGCRINRSPYTYNDCVFKNYYL